jgi:hypothetical protein
VSGDGHELDDLEGANTTDVSKVSQSTSLFLVSTYTKRALKRIMTVMRLPVSIRSRDRVGRIHVASKASVMMLSMMIG